MKGTKEDYIKYRISKSAEVFKDAKLLAKNKRWNSCVNRLYYSSFYMVNALLYFSEIKAHTHNGAKTKFFQEFIKTGKISRENGKLYSNLLDWRQESDYADFIKFDENTVKPLLKQVWELNHSIKKLIVL